MNGLWVIPRNGKMLAKQAWILGHEYIRYTDTLGQGPMLKEPLMNGNIAAHSQSEEKRLRKNRVEQFCQV